tara:strand:- start:53 stop:646 length:594 start_codon:yes stop_codon:yes gene_type:complete
LERNVQREIKKDFPDMSGQQLNNIITNLVKHRYIEKVEHKRNRLNHVYVTEPATLINDLLEWSKEYHKDVFEALGEYYAKVENKKIKYSQFETILTMILLQSFAQASRLRSKGIIYDDMKMIFAVLVLPNLIEFFKHKELGARLIKAEKDRSKKIKGAITLGMLDELHTSLLVDLLTKKKEKIREHVNSLNHDGNDT